jgi:alcohol dehydrogenase class IV
MTVERFRFPTQIRFGAGARQALREFAGEYGVRRPLLVTDDGLARTDAFAMVRATLDAVWPDAWHHFGGVHPNPRIEDADAAYRVYADAGCDAVVALGGGSAIDGAKALVLRIAAPTQALTDIALASLPRHVVPLCAIPTTAGTGSEVGQSTVVTVAALGRKVVLGAPALLPALAILDPELTVGLPPHLTAATGMDAMTHAIESFVCPVFHPMCDGIALEAVYRIRHFLPRAVADGRDLDARGEMLMAAAMGAVAFQKDLGAAHSLAHPLSTEFGVHHGLANALVLPTVVRFNAAGGTDYTRVAVALGLAAADAPGAAVATALETLAGTIGITQRLRDVVPDAALLPGLAAKAFTDDCHRTNPRPCTTDDLLHLYREAW